MISFKQFLSEAPHDNSASDFKYSPSMISVIKSKKGKAFIGNPEYADEPGSDQYQKISSTATHDFYRWHRPIDKKSHSTEFYAVDKKTGHVHMHVEGTTHGKKNKIFAVDLLRAGHGNTLKAHEFYHHLLHAGHVNSLVSDESHSPGAKKVWHRLSQMPNIKMHTATKKIKPNTVNDVSFPKKGEVEKEWDKNYSNKHTSKKFYTRFVAKTDIKRK